MAIYDPERNDVLCGRGKFAMNWNGNLLFTSLVKSNKVTYFASDLKAKKKISKSIVDQIYSLSPPGRFLKMHDYEWVELSYKQAIQKARQALREDARHFIGNHQEEDSENHSMVRGPSNIRDISNQDKYAIDTTNLISESSDNKASSDHSSQQIIGRKYIVKCTYINIKSNKFLILQPRSKVLDQQHSIASVFAISRRSFKLSLFKQKR